MLKGEPVSQDLDYALPRWVAGVDLRQTAMDCVQVVGEVPRPIALHGMDAIGLEWLRQLDGARSWVAQVSEAQARGIPADQARRVLVELFESGLVVDSGLPEAGVVFKAPTVVGSRQLAEIVVSLMPGTEYLSHIPKARDGAGWRVEIERISDEVRQSPAIVVLDRPTIDSAEFELLSTLIDRKVSHVVVGAGVRTARVGPITIDGQGPCVRCDEELKLELDPSWRHLAAEFSLDPPPMRVDALATLAAAETVRQLAQFTLSATAAHNAVLTSGYGGGPWLRRRLVHHQRCSCWWAAIEPGEPSAASVPAAS